MRDCPDDLMRDLLPLHAAGRLGAGDRAGVEAHLAACADCRAELALLRAVGRAFAMPAPDVAAIVAAVPAHGASRLLRATRVPFHRQPMWRLAAGITLLVAATATYVAVRGGLGGTGAGPHAVPDSAAATAAQLAAGGAPQGPDTDLAPAAPMEPAAGAAIRLGVSLHELSDAQVEALLAAMDGLEGNVLADPEVIAKPILAGTDGGERRN